MSTPLERIAASLERIEKLLMELITVKAASKKPPKLNGQNSEALEVLQFLNENSGKAFRPVDSNLEIISARLKEGYTAADMRKVIVRKCSQWKGGDMEIYLRPETLFNRTKMAQYSGELVVPGE